MYLTRVRTPKFLPKKLYQAIIGDLVFNDSQSKFWKSVELIFSEEAQVLLGPDKIRYLQKLLAIKEKWASAFAPHMFMAGTHTTSRIEAMNSWLKQTLDHKSSLIDVMNTFESLDRRVEQMNLEGPVRQQVYEHPLLKSMTKTMSRYAFEHMLYQFSQSNHHRVRFTKKRLIPLLEEG